MNKSSEKKREHTESTFLATMARVPLKSNFSINAILPEIADRDTPPNDDGSPAPSAPSEMDDASSDGDVNVDYESENEGKHSKRDRETILNNRFGAFDLCVTVNTPKFYEKWKKKSKWICKYRALWLLFVFPTALFWCSYFPYHFKWFENIQRINTPLNRGQMKTLHHLFCLSAEIFYFSNNRFPWIFHLFCFIGNWFFRNPICLPLNEVCLTN